MREDATRLRKSLIDIPQGTGSADAREVKVGCGLPFRDIAGAVDPHEEERHTARLGTLKR